MSFCFSEKMIRLSEHINSKNGEDVKRENNGYCLMRKYMEKQGGNDSKIMHLFLCYTIS